MLSISTTTQMPLRQFLPLQTLQLLRAAGFSCADASLHADAPEAACWQNGEWRDKAQQLADAAQQAGVRFTQAHAPFPADLPTAQQREVAYTAVENAVRAAGILGSPYIVVHPLVYTRLPYPAQREEILQENIRFFTRLAPVAQQSNITIAIENMFSYSPAHHAYMPVFGSAAEDLAQLLAALQGPFCACVDTGHAWLNGVRPGDFARALGAQVQVLHVHDNCGGEDEHTVPYLGTIDWADFCLALHEIGFDGTLSLETPYFEENLPARTLPKALAFMAVVAQYLSEQCEKAASAQQG